MWTIDLPDVDEVDKHLDMALIQKDGHIVYPLTPVERKAIHDLYHAYDSLEGQPHASLLPAALEGCKDVIHDAYAEVQKKRRLARLRGALLASVRECPLCGYADATTLDHYLPKSDYRALAIYPRNLIPSCQSCNRAKGTIVPGGTNAFIHAYFQTLPDEEFLHADINYNSGELIVKFRIDHLSLDNDTIGKLRFHIDRLNLNERYFAQINTFLFSLKTSIEFFQNTAEHATQLKFFFERSAASYAKDFGVNHWRAALMRALAASDEFCTDPGAYLQRPLTSIQAQDEVV